MRAFVLALLAGSAIAGAAPQHTGTVTWEWDAIYSRSIALTSHVVTYDLYVSADSGVTEFKNLETVYGTSAGYKAGEQVCGYVIPVIDGQESDDAESAQSCVTATGGDVFVTLDGHGS